MKKICLTALFLVFLTAPACWASPWAVVANYNDYTIHTIDLGTGPPTVYGPFLGGQLGSGHLYDVAITPDGHYALVSSFYADVVYRIDLTDPTNPVLAGSLNLGTDFGPEDIAISPNGAYALVTDGSSSNQIAVIDLSDFTLTTVYTLTTDDARAQAVAIAPDNRTVIVCDYYNDRIIFGAVDPTNPAAGLPMETTIDTGSGPINVAISPDGRTALVSNANDATVSVFEITGPGVVLAGTTNTVDFLPGDQHSIAFAPNGQRAYVESTDMVPAQLSWLQINGPGNVTLGGAGVANLLTAGSDCFFGIDVLAVTPDDSFAVVGNPFSSGASPDVALVNLSTWVVTNIDTDSDFPVGIDIFAEPYSPATIPTFTEWGVIVLFLLTAVTGLAMIRRRRLSA